MSSTSIDNPYEQISMSDSDEDKKPEEEVETPIKKKKKDKGTQEEEYGPVGKTVVNLRKSLGHVTKNIIGKDTHADDKPGINLAELEVIEIEDSDEENPKTKEEKKGDAKRSELAYFDYMPDEVIFNIFNRLPERDMGRFALTCKRLYGYIETEDIWKPKAANWINLRVSRGNRASENLREFYVAKYQENARKEEEQRRARIVHESKLRKEKRIKDVVEVCNSTIFNYRVYDIPICICVIIWTILMALRDDEYILCSYHLVFLPLYVGYFYVAASCFVAFPILEAANTAAIYPTFEKNLLSFIADECKLWGFPVVGVPWSVSLAFFMIYDFAKESYGEIDESYSFIPIALVALPSFFACFGVCFYQRIKRCRCNEECGISTFGMLVFGYFGWLFAFLAVKSDYYVTFNWGVGFIPFWLIFSGIVIGYTVGAIAMLTGPSHNERKIFMLFSLFFVPGFLGLVAWFVLLDINLDAQDRDLPMIPWILVDTPVIAMEVAFTVGIGFLMERLRN